MKIEFHHICIETDCYENSIEFYTKAMGFMILSDTKNFHNRNHNTWLINENVIIELQTPKHKNEPTIIGNRGIMHICFKVSNLEEAIEGIEREVNAVFLNDRKIYEVMGNRLCKIVAPEGTIIELRE